MPEFPGPDGCSARFHKPSGYEHDDALPAPAPIGPFARSLSAFDGTDPNGDWRLFIDDDDSGLGGVLTGGWSLEITARVRK